MAPKVSVAVITYNQESFIEQCLDGILMQQTDFPFDIWIGEDNSTDATRAIVQAYQRRHPKQIHLLLHERKDVIYIDGRPTGRWNLMDTLRHTTGAYVAFTEGDDYWTDPRKLQKQADHLDQHPDHAMCFHYVTKIYEDGSKAAHRFPVEKARTQYTLIDLIQGINTPSTSLMYRNGLFGDFPEWYRRAPQGDWPLHMLNAQHGVIGFLPETMGAYRIHDGGIFSTQSELQKLRWEVEKFCMLNEHLEYVYDRVFRSELEWRYSRIARIEGRKAAAFNHLCKHLATSPTTAFARPRRVAVHAVKTLWPNMGGRRASVRNRRADT